MKCPHDDPPMMSPEVAMFYRRTFDGTGLHEQSSMGNRADKDSERAAEAPNPAFGATTSEAWKQRETAGTYASLGGHRCRARWRVTRERGCQPEGSDEAW